jgi:hypothetical protein
MIDVPAGVIPMIRKRVAEGHPDADFRGIDPTIPAFP